VIIQTAGRLLTVILCCLIGVCTSSTDGYSNRKEGISIKFPEGWKINKNVRTDSSASSAILVGVEAPADEETRIIITRHIRQGQHHATVDSYFILKEGNLSRACKNYTKEEDGISIINNRKARWFTYSFGVGEDPRKVMVILLESKEKIYEICLDTRKSKYSKYKSIFDESTKTIRLTDD